jgi:hypothetical protein
MDSDSLAASSAVAADFFPLVEKRVWRAAKGPSHLFCIMRSRSERVPPRSQHHSFSAACPVRKIAVLGR